MAPPVAAFVSDPQCGDADYFDTTSESVFFTLFPNVFVSYSETVAQVLNVAALVLLIALAFAMVKRNGAAFRKLAAYAFGLLVAIIAAAIFAFAFAFLWAGLG